MHLLVISFVAGLLTVLAPCILPLLPIIVGGSSASKSRTRPLIIAVSLALSVIVFTLLLKASTALIMVPPIFWKLVSGSILIAFGLVALFPQIWDKLAIRYGWGAASQRLLAKATRTEGWMAPVLIGAALGPVFSSCSPTYVVIIATVLPNNFSLGLTYLIAYSLGLAGVLLALGYLGQSMTNRLSALANPHGWFKRGLGLLFVLIGISVLTGFDKRVETYLLDHNLAPAVNIEQLLLPKTGGQASANGSVNNTNSEGAVFSLDSAVTAPEIKGIDAWINSSGESLASSKGKVVLIDFWTYSCINCIHTIPHVKDLYAKYKDQGLVVIGLHAPEFSFERVEANVRKAVSDEGITYPVGLDNNYATWSAYHNQYWPAEYFIDRTGRIRHTHFGEGGYENNEKVIRALLAEGGNSVSGGVSSTQTKQPNANMSPETYLGYARAQRNANAGGLVQDKLKAYILADKLGSNEWALGGNWTAGAQDTVSGAGATLQFKFSGTDVYLVMGATQAAGVKVLVNGQSVGSSGLAGSDVDSSGLARVEGARLYRLVHSTDLQRGATLELQFPIGVTINAFTFDS